MKQISEKLFIVIDGSSYLYRAYYVFSSLRNSMGEPIGAIYGVLNMLRSLILQYHPVFAVVVFDSSGGTFRNKLYQSYKLHRRSMPINLQMQIKPLYAMIKAMGFPIITVPGVEADDVIGTIAKKAEKEGYFVLISTSDKDIAQLVTSKIILLNTMSKIFLGPQEVMCKYGVPPKLITDLIALNGDRSDNIPGVSGIGKKNALTLLNKIGGLDEIYFELEKIVRLSFPRAKVLVEKLKKNKEIAFLSYQLAKIKTNVKLGVTFEQLKIQHSSTEELLSLFNKYEFKRWSEYIKSGKWLPY